MSIFSHDHKINEYFTSNPMRLFIFMAFILIVLVGIAAVLVFFVNVSGAEQTMVPDVIGQDLTSALLELQVKELYPRINLRYTQSSADKGLILEQNPLPGAIVRAGRRIQLTISQGVIVNTIENYLGRNIEEVRIDLQTIIASQTSTQAVPQYITLREPPMYEYAMEAAGTILQQRPEPGTSYSGPTTLELVVSRGPENTMVRLSNLLGLGLGDALETIGLTGIDFEFALRPSREGERAGTVVAQYPGGDTLAASSGRVSLTMSIPDNLPDNEVFGLFVYEMAKNPYPLLIRLESIQPGGERRRLLQVQYAGGRLSVPYRESVGTILVLSMLNREIYRETVTRSVDSLSLDQF
jgi:beta-lactam-binding protein with PASTA domain